MVHVADELADDLAAVGGEDVEVALTGASGMWADFNTANPRGDAEVEPIRGR